MSDFIDEVSKEKILKIAQKMAWNDLEEEKKDKSDENQENDQNKDQQDKNQEGEKKKLPPQKIPAKLKQLMSDDRQLQLKIIEQNTRDMNRRKSRQNKDW